MDSGIWLCVGKVLGTPRHPSVDSYSRHVLLCVFDQSSKNVGLLLNTNIPTLLGVHQLVIHAFDAVGFVVFSSPFKYLVSFRVLGEAIVGFTWNPNTVH